MSASNILIVDDERDLRDTLKEIFEVSGFSVVAASNGEEALSVMQTWGKPCLLLLDLMMPVMNGWELLKRLKSDTPHLFDEVPIFVISAVADTSDIRQQYGCEVMKKPLNVARLLDVASRHCSIGPR